jgi:hypothetical protein
MIYYTPAHRRTLALFKTPFDQALNPENRWVKMAEIVPWDEMAKVFHSRMSRSRGRGSIDLRIVMGALLVKHIEGLSDEDTIQYIEENIYAQFFVGLASFQARPVFVATLFVEIRKRLGNKGAQELNDLLLKQSVELRAIKHRRKPVRKALKSIGSANDQGGNPPAASDNSSDNSAPLSGDQTADETQQEEATEAPLQENGETPPENRGVMKLDATVAPQNIGYPLDTKLLSQAREQSELLIDRMYHTNDLWNKKPRTYRRKAHEAYIAFTKNRRPTQKQIKKARGKQLNYLRRNLSTIDQMLTLAEGSDLDSGLTPNDLRKLMVLHELHRQQDIMHRDGRKQIADRIVSISQPHVRAIKRGKAGKDTEFGAKLNVSETEGFVRIDQISFDNFNEGICLKEQVEGYRKLYGYYPELVLADRIFLNRDNRNYLKEKNIRHAGKQLGRPVEMSANEKERRRKEQNKRSEIEGKFGEAKTKYGLDNIKTKRADTTYAHIGFIFLAMNLVKLTKELLFALIRSFINRCECLWEHLIKWMLKMIIPAQQPAILSNLPRSA